LEVTAAISPPSGDTALPDMSPTVVVPTVEADMEGSSTVGDSNTGSSSMDLEFEVENSGNMGDTASIHSPPRLERQSTATSETEMAAPEVYAAAPPPSTSVEIETPPHENSRNANDEDDALSSLDVLAELPPLIRAASASRRMALDHFTWCLIIQNDLVLGVVQGASAFDSMNESSALPDFTPSERSKKGHPVSMQTLQHPPGTLRVPSNSQLWRLTKEGYLVNKDGFVLELEESMLLKSVVADTDRTGSGGAYVVAHKLDDVLPESTPLNRHWDYVTFQLSDDTSAPQSLLSAPIIDHGHRLTPPSGHFVNSLGVALDAGNPSRGEVTAGGLVAAFQVRGLQPRQLWAMQPVEEVDGTVYEGVRPAEEDEALKPLGIRSKSAPGRVNTEQGEVLATPLLLKRARSHGTKKDQGLVPEPEWRRLALGALSKRVLNGTYKLNEKTLKRLLDEHKVKPNLDLADAELEEGEDLRNAFGKSMEYSTTEAKWKEMQTEGQCLICLEVKNGGSTLDCNGIDGGGVLNPCKAAGVKGCKGEVCYECLQQYFLDRVESTRYSVPAIPCPCCLRRIPTRFWKVLMGNLDVPSLPGMNVMKLYEQSATGLLSVRCPSCHSTHSTYIKDEAIDDPKCERQICLEKIFDGLEPAHVRQVVQAWKDYESCSISPEVFMHILLASRYVVDLKQRKQKAEEDAIVRKKKAAEEQKKKEEQTDLQVEKKWIQVGSQWRKNPHFGADAAVEVSGKQNVSKDPDPARESSSVETKPPMVEEVVDLQILYSTIEAEEFPKYKLKSPDYATPFFTLWEDDTAGEHGADPTSMPLKGALYLQLIQDAERRLALQLAFVRRFPFINHLGCSCGSDVCFKCKISEHHEGETCEDKQRAMCDVDAQFCPSCGVATIRTEGCSSMICICGTYWEWQGEERGIPEPYRPCWGGETVVYTPDGEKRVKHVEVGDEVMTAKGTYRAVAKKWGSRIVDSPGYRSGRVEVARIRGFWITSHHPVLQGNEWMFPAEMGTTTSAMELYQKGVLDSLYNLELEGHNDTIILGSDSGIRENTISCTIGKYLGSRFGYSVFTRRTTRCDHPCAQCEVVYEPTVNFSAIPNHLRWKIWEGYEQVEWNGPLEWGGEEWMETKICTFVESHEAHKKIESHQAHNKMGVVTEPRTYRCGARGTGLDRCHRKPTSTMSTPVSEVKPTGDVHPLRVIDNDN
jgi:hypothetical protein